MMSTFWCAQIAMEDELEHRRKMLRSCIFQVCPAGWKPGKATITPNPTDKLKYFTEANKA